MKYLTFFLIFVMSFKVFSDEQQMDLPLSSLEQVASFNETQEFLIGGIISPLTGLPSLQQIDLSIPGAEPVTISRSFIPTSIPSSYDLNDMQSKVSFYQYANVRYRGWTILPQLCIEVFPFFQTIRISDSNGAILEFAASPRTGRYQLRNTKHGINNFSNGQVSGKYDLRNIRVEVLEKDKKILVVSPNGTKRIYKQLSIHSKDRFRWLEKEILPSGKILKYSYAPLNYDFYYKLVKIECTDPSEQFTYTTINVKGHPLEGHYLFSAANFPSLEYKFHRQSSEISYEAKTLDGKKKIRTTVNSPYLLKSIRGSYFSDETIEISEQLLLTSYESKNHLFKCGYSSHQSKSDPNAYFRVRELNLPVGINDSFVPVYKMTYDSPIADVKEGITYVKKCDGSQTIYRFTKSLLISAIEQYDSLGTLQSKKSYHWHDNGWLAFQELRDGSNLLLHKKSYEYDSFGNPVTETLSGDLSGFGNVESYPIKRQFSTDGLHLLLKEETEDQAVTEYKYIPATNLLSSKYTKKNEKILSREIYEYDPQLNLIRKILDDGSGLETGDLTGVSFRKIEEYTLRQTDPHLHMKEWITEKYWDGEEEKPLRKIHLSYDQRGNICKEDVYDANNELTYTIKRKFNERGDLLWETNAKGDQASYEYDKKGRLVSFTPFSNQLTQRNNYDKKGRVIQLEERTKDGGTHSTFFSYDSLDNVISKTDYLGNTTHYQFDSITKKPTSVLYPSTRLKNNELRTPKESFSYNALGLKTVYTDSNGFQTVYKYNTYGQPSEISYPNNSKETFRYYKNGNLYTHTDRDGLVITYNYDSLDRIVSKSYSSSSGSKITEEQFTYNSFQQLSWTDKEGHTTFYHYDKAGRLAHESRLNNSIEYGYDSLERKNLVRYLNGVNTLETHFKYDLLDRIVEETKTDLQGNILFKETYTYDSSGNQRSLTRYIDNQTSTRFFDYDGFNRLRNITDGEGQSTFKYWEECNSVNPEQRELKVTTVAPNQIKTISTYNDFGKEIKTSTLDKDGNLISSKEYFYDLCNNLTETSIHVFKNGKYQSTQVLRYCYDALNKITSFSQGSNNEEKTVYYTYFPSGLKSSQTLPNGTTIHYGYDDFKNLNLIRSSDGSIHHTFVYNKLGALLRAKDHNEKIAIQREVDAFGNIVKEELDGLLVSKTYDDLGRVSSLTLPDNSEIRYSYNPLQLKEIARISTDQETLYSHSFTKYDLSGHLLEELLPFGSGKVSYHYDLEGRLIEISNPYLSQNYNYDRAGNMVYSQVNHTPSFYQYDSLSQLVSERKNNSSHFYLYDSNYNLLLKDDKTAEVNSLNELTKIGKTTYTYDINGNLTSKANPSGDYQYTFDLLNRLVEVTTPQNKISFTYDPLGRCLSKKVEPSSWFTWQSSSVERYIYDGMNEIGSLNESDSIKELKIHNSSLSLPSKPIAIELNGTPYIPHCDLQGNVCLLQDPFSKKTAQYYDYNAFGECATSSYQSPFNPWRYAAKRYIPELNLVYFGKRYYDPEIQRWLSEDPAGFVDCANLYAYVLNNPLKYYDPYGQFAVAIPLLVWGAEVVAPYVVPFIVKGLVAGAIAWGGYEIADKIHENWNKTEYSSIDYSRSLEENLLLREIQKSKKDPKKYSSLAKSDESKRHSSDQGALSELVKEYGKKGVSNSEADVLLEWAKEYDFPHRDDRGKWDEHGKPHWEGGEHIHLGPKHVKVN